MSESSNSRYCTHIKADGVQCGSFAYDTHELCYFHHRDAERARRRAELGTTADILKCSGIDVPSLEDRASIQLAIQDVMIAVLTHRITHRDASLLLRALNLACRNLAKEPVTPSQKQGEAHVDCEELADRYLFQLMERPYSREAAEEEERRYQAHLAKKKAKEAAEQAAAHEAATNSTSGPEASLKVAAAPASQVDSPDSASSNPDITLQAAADPNLIPSIHACTDTPPSNSSIRQSDNSSISPNSLLPASPNSQLLAPNSCLLNILTSNSSRMNILQASPAKIFKTHNLKSTPVTFPIRQSVKSAIRQFADCSILPGN